MTVLKSFELKGNKQSFASWISTLSPCDTPFVSMIGKEGTSQTQYSWQMDALDIPRNDSFEEGSEAVAQSRHPTHVNHNFTSILRKVAHISDTVAALDTYGRNSEMAYQMGKAGKELKRDMEFMCLNNDTGNIGTSSVAGKFAGFTGLCAPKGYVDVSTGAVTYKEVNVADLTGPWFKTSDLFDLTYNLYLAGSKANKIMFHPFHATTFSDFMSDNIETPLVYRMFDGLDDKFNKKVSKIRDPLCQVYDLIPNRFMPKDKIYIFNESDWTQMILRAPAVSPLSKQGSSDRYLLESEVGLRHRHVNASGVLEMAPSTLLIEWTSKPNPLTAGINQNQEASVLIKVRETGLPVPNGTVFNWSSSNPLVVSVDPTGHTADGQANSLLTPHRAGTSIITVSSLDGRASYLVTVGNPNVKLTVPSPLMEVNQTSLLDAYVTDHEGKGVDGITVNFSATPGHLLEFTSISAETAGGGTAKVDIKALQLGLAQVQAAAGGVTSLTGAIHIVQKVELMSMEIAQKEIAHNVNDRVNAIITVRGATGVGIPNKIVTLKSSDPSVIQPAADTFTTDAQGAISLALTAKEVGDTVMIAEFGDQVFEVPMAVRPPHILLEGPSSYTVGVAFDMQATVTRSDSSLLSHVDVSFTSIPAFSPAIADVQTQADGIATAQYTPNSNTDLEVTASAGGYNSNSLSIVGP